MVRISTPLLYKIDNLGVVQRGAVIRVTATPRWDAEEGAHLHRQIAERAGHDQFVVVLCDEEQSINITAPAEKP